ncbi:hypothetical protein [Cohnella fermenti]|uniref:Uncharacterized protein n=1 Tax=Cohnella fermenti TaxID=2565925 RepID=A0A4S4BFW5_9BACL|nr:hypothetical protein [Cohnella fermenti]THF73266.1 hypothetical protein E6C55_30035 [Cohnella fermenti]
MDEQQAPIPVGLVLQIDMQIATEFDTIEVDSGDSPNYGRQYIVQSDADWGAQLAQTAGEPGTTTISVPKTRARLVNVWQTGTSDTPWTVTGIRVYNGDNPYPGKSGLGVNCTPDTCRLSWKAVDGADGYSVYRSGSLNGTYSRVHASTGDSLEYSDEGL